jgi:hypothetical protein
VECFLIKRIFNEKQGATIPGYGVYCAVSAEMVVNSKRGTEKKG